MARRHVATYTLSIILFRTLPVTWLIIDDAKKLRRQKNVDIESCMKVVILLYYLGGVSSIRGKSNDEHWVNAERSSYFCVNSSIYRCRPDKICVTEFSNHFSNNPSATLSLALTLANTELMNVNYSQHKHKRLLQ